MVHIPENMKDIIFIGFQFTGGLDVTLIAHVFNRLTLNSRVFNGFGAEFNYVLWLG